MIRVHIVVEGPTEEKFINELLYPLFILKNIHLIPHLVGRGGIINYGPVKQDILQYMKQERDAFCTTMIDFFHLPKDFPGMPIKGNLSTEQKAAAAEKALVEDIQKEFSDTLRPDRFHPYFQMHEFEGLLFSAPQLFAQAIDKENLIEDLKEIRDSFPTPEDIDDENAPSYRIKELLPEYEKVTLGTLAALNIGLDRIRKECNHFNQWINAIETLCEAN